jgi:uncharacterized membrane protein
MPKVMVAGEATYPNTDSFLTYVTFGQAAMAIGMIAWGLLNLVTGDFASPWQGVPAWVPARTFLAYACGALMLLTGIGLLIKHTAALASQILLVFLILWLVLLKLPDLFTAPLVEASWLAVGEIVVIVCGGWTVYATLNNRDLKWVRYVFGFWLIPIGLSHFFYFKGTSSMVPAWLPFRPGWAAVGGAGHIAAGLAVLFGVYPRVAGTLEAGMITAFTLLVWVIPLLSAPTSAAAWTPVIVSLAIGNAAFAVAEKLP